jgi:hypothetical protein
MKNILQIKHEIIGLKQIWYFYQSSEIFKTFEI